MKGNRGEQETDNYKYRGTAYRKVVNVSAAEDREKKNLKRKRGKARKMKRGLRIILPRALGVAV